MKFMNTRIAFGAVLWGRCLARFFNRLGLDAMLTSSELMLLRIDQPERIRPVAVPRVAHMLWRGKKLCPICSAKTQMKVYGIHDGRHGA